MESTEVIFAFRAVFGATALGTADAIPG